MQPCIRDKDPSLQPSRIPIRTCHLAHLLGSVPDAYVSHTYQTARGTNLPVRLGVGWEMAYMEIVRSMHVRTAPMRMQSIASL